MRGEWSYSSSEFIKSSHQGDMFNVENVTGCTNKVKTMFTICRVLNVLMAMYVLPALVVSADDWPQWLGPNLDSNYREEGVLSVIPEQGLEVLWRTPIAGGYAGPAVAGDHVFVTDYVRKSGEAKNDPGIRNELQGTEQVHCLNRTTGKILWTHSYDCPYKISYPAGPRATPTVDGDRVYTLGAEGHLFCLNTNNGDVIWSKQFQKDYQATAPIWGFCAHPLIDGDTLYCVVGGDGSVAVAFDKMTGEEKWRALSASEQGYCPPTIIEAAGVRQLLIWDADNLSALNPKTGEVLWSNPLKPAYGMSIAAPRKSGDLLFASAIRNVGTVFQLNQEKPGAVELWTGNAKSGVYSANSTPVITEGVIYGTDYNTGGLRAVDLQTGEIFWESWKPTTGTRRSGHGTAFIVKHGKTYFLFSETGDLITANLSKTEYQETGRFHILEPTGEAFGRSVVWTHPAFANQCCYVRNDKEIVCVSLKAKD